MINVVANVFFVGEHLMDRARFHARPKSVSRPWAFSRRQFPIHFSLR